MGHRGRMAPGKLERARQMRSRPTPSEAALWERLRSRQVDGWKFTRQALMAGYIVDFYAPQAGLVVEVDGAVHDDPSHRLDDAHRDSVLAGLGYRVMRVSALDVEMSIDAVITRIAARLAEPPTPYWAKR